MQTTEQRSSTPILDLFEPLPRSLYDRRSNRLLYFIVTLCLFACVTRNYAVPLFCLWVVLLWWIKVAIHELGHLLAGWVVGMRFESVAIGSCWVIREAGWYKFRFRSNLFLGQVNMGLSRLRKVRMQLVVLTLGGPAATVLSLIAVIVLVGFFGSRLGNFAPGLVDASIYIFAIVSLFSFCFGLFPRSYGVVPNDTLALKLLLTSKAEAKRMMAAYALHLQIRKGTDPLNLNRRWIALGRPAGAGPEAEYEKNWEQYTAALSNNPGSAADPLEKCLAASAILSAEQRDHLKCEAAFFNAKYRQSVANAQRWLALVSQPQKIHALSEIRVQSAIHFAKRTYSEAIALCDEALRILESFPPGAPARDLLPSWLIWRQEIELRLDGAGDVQTLEGIVP